MKHVYFATPNSGDIEKIATELREHDISVEHVPLHLPDSRSHEIAGIAAEKVRYAYSHTQGPTITNESGFFIPALSGFPRSHTDFVLETIGIKGILKLAEGCDRECEFRSSLAYIDKDHDEPVFFESIITGSLAFEESGTDHDYHWSRLFFIFIPDGYDKTLAEMEPEEFNRWWESQKRQSVFHKFANWYRGETKE